jgi:LPS sulfotransferase NodH
MNKFVILAPGRSGSTMLMRRLQSNPDVHIQSEILDPNICFSLTIKQRIYARIGRKFGTELASFNLQFNGRNFLPVVNNLAWGRAYRNMPVCGFKLITDHWITLSGDQKQAFLAAHEFKVIFLTRKNILGHLISTLQAQENGFRHRIKGQAEVNLPPVDINLGDVRAFQKSEYIKSSLARADFVSSPIIETTYEDLVTHPERENARLLEFIGADSHPLSDALAKNSSSDISGRVANFEAFARSLRGTVYEPMLSDITATGA